jgi:hypothetical protein
MAWRRLGVFGAHGAVGLGWLRGAGLGSRARATCRFGRGSASVLQAGRRGAGGEEAGRGARLGALGAAAWQPGTRGALLLRRPEKSKGRREEREPGKGGARAQKGEKGNFPLAAAAAGDWGARGLGLGGGRLASWA